MSIERWDLSPSSRPDTYVMKIAGNRSDLEKVIEKYKSLCSEPQEMSGPEFQWFVYIENATLNERLAIQDRLRELVSTPAPTHESPSVDLSGVLAELNLVLEELTGLTEEEQAQATKKMQEIQQREAVPAPPLPIPDSPNPSPPMGRPIQDQIVPPPNPTPLQRPAPSPPAPPAPPSPPTVTPPSPVKPPPPEPPARVTPPPSSPMTNPPIERPKPLEPLKPVLPVAPSLSKPKLVPKIKKPALPDTSTPPDQLIKAVFFYRPDGESIFKSFLGKLKETALTKAKKPLTVQAVESNPSKISNSMGTEWISKTQAAGADCFFVMLPSDILADFLEAALLESRTARVPCFLVSESDIKSRLLYVDLMVELMFIKRKK